MPRFTDHDIRAAVSRSAYEKAEELVWLGRVVTVTVGADGFTIKAQVQGSRAEPYRQTITIAEQASRGRRIIGECTCPMAHNCKHVAAALIAVLEDEAAVENVEDETALPALWPQLDRPSFGSHRPDLVIRPPASPAAPPAVSPQVSAWLDDLARMQLRMEEAYPDKVQQRLVYVLAPEPHDAGVPALRVTPNSTRVKKDGTFSEPASAYDPSNVLKPSPAQFLRPADRVILRKLCGMPRSPWGAAAGIVLRGEEADEVLRAILATGRARLESLNGREAKLGEARPGSMVWQLLDDGTQRPVIALDGDLAALRLAPPWWLDRSGGLLGPIDTGLPPPLAEALLSSPAVKPEEAAFVQERLMQRIGLAAVPAPRTIEPAQRLREKAVPVLRLAGAPMPPRRTGQLSWRELYGPARQPVPTPVARLSFRYGPIEIPADERGNVIQRAREGRLFAVGRNHGLERRSANRLFELGLRPARLIHFYPFPPPSGHAEDLLLQGDQAETGWLDILYRAVPALRAEGWIVEIADDFPVRLTVASGEIAMRIEESSGIDWFELDLGVMVDGERVDLVPALIELIGSPGFDAAALDAAEAERPLYLPLADGQVIALPFERIRPILAVLRELFDAGAVEPGAERIGFSRFGAADLAALEETAGALAWATAAGEGLLALGRMLRDTGRIPPAVVPDTFKASLRPYQARGVDWLQTLGLAGLGGILADDMGLGKTVQALAHLTIERAAGRLDRPALVVAPTSLVGNWRREAERFAPDLRVLTLHGPDRKTRFGEIAQADLVLTTYPLLARDQAELTVPDWSVVLLDEAHTIKNPDAVTTKLAAKLRARQRLCLTGTPVENHLGELWSLFSFVAPGFLGDRERFRRNYRTPIEKRGDVVRRQGLARRIRPFVLRRTKAEVAADLPPKTEIVEQVEMENAQRAIYESIRLAMHDRVREAIAARGLKRSSIVILDALLKMRQACCDPRLLKLKADEAAKAGSAKRERLMEILPALVEEERRILLFSQFTSMLALIERDLEAAGLPYVLLTGDTRDRDTPVREFQNGRVPLFLISLKAGGVGLNLTAADTVIHYDPWWNPAVEDQANDRAHRIGQDKPVFVHKLMVTNSIEEKMEALKARKRELVAGLFDAEAGGPLELAESDIEELFAAG